MFSPQQEDQATLDRPPAQLFFYISIPVPTLPFPITKTDSLEPPPLPTPQIHADKTTFHRQPRCRPLLASHQLNLEIIPRLLPFNNLYLSTRPAPASPSTIARCNCTTSSFFLFQLRYVPCRSCTSSPIVSPLYPSLIAHQATACHSYFPEIVPGDFASLFLVAITPNLPSSFTLASSVSP